MLTCKVIFLTAHHALAAVKGQTKSPLQQASLKSRIDLQIPNRTDEVIKAAIAA